MSYSNIMLYIKTLIDRNRINKEEYEVAGDPNKIDDTRSIAAVFGV